MPGDDQGRALLDDWFEAQKRIWELWLGPSGADDADTRASGPSEADGSTGGDRADDRAAPSDRWAEAAGDALRAWAELVSPVVGAMSELVVAGAEGAAELFELSAGLWAPPSAGAGPDGTAGPDWGHAAAAFGRRLNGMLLGAEPAWAPGAGLRRAIDTSWRAWEATAGRVLDAPTVGQPSRIREAFAKATRAWAELQRASADYQAILAGGWGEAWAAFLAALPERPPATLRQLLRLWGTTADVVLSELFATEAYARAQGHLVNAAMRYRLAERELADRLLEMSHVPSRTELDEANRAIHDLRSELRRLRKDVRR